MSILKNLLLSKKFVVSLLTLAGSVATYLGWHVDPTTILAVITPVLVYVGAQGWADSGKEKALVEQQTALKTQGLAMEHEVNLTALRSSLKSDGAPVSDKERDAAHTVALSRTRVAIANSQSGFAHPAVMIAVAGAMFLMLAFGSAACSHPLQTTLKAGQCVLDSGVLDTVLGDLEQANYKQLVSDLDSHVAPQVVDCALIAAASQKPAAGSGSAAAAPRTGAFTASVDVASRARELLAARHASSN